MLSCHSVLFARLKECRAFVTIGDVNETNGKKVVSDLGRYD